MFNPMKVARILASFSMIIAAMAIGLDGAEALFVFTIAYVIVGYEVLWRAVTDMVHLRPFNENTLMTIATLGAFIIGEYMEGVAVLIFYQTGEYFQEYAVNKSRRSIKSLMNLMPDSANVKTDDGIVTKSPSEVGVGEIVIIRPGERIPLDCTVIEGSAMIDTSSMTGESVPRGASVGDHLFSGCICANGVLVAKVTSTHDDSAATKVLTMIEEAYECKSKSEAFVTKFAKYYTPIVALCALLLATIPTFIFNQDLNEWTYRALTFLVISCPCAVVISVPLSFFGGIGGSSKAGILIKGGNYLEALANVDTVIFDKTGTLTKGVFKVIKVSPVSISERDLLMFAAYSEFHSNHPIANGILSAFDEPIDESRTKLIEEASGQGLISVVDGREVLVGNRKLMEAHGMDVQEETFGTIVHVAVDGDYAGCIVISDIIKDDSKKAISDLKGLGIKEVCILTGDSKAVGMHVANEVGADSVISELLPGEKLEVVLGKIVDGRRVAFVGDGINDAPSIARADVGIAMGGLGSDAAIESADVVILDDMPSKIPLGIKIAKKTRNIALMNIVFAIGVKILFLIGGALGLISLTHAIFADVGVSVIAIVNAMRALRVPR